MTKRIYKHSVCLLLIMNFSVKSAENAIMSLVKTGVKTGAEIFLSKAPSAIFDNVFESIHYIEHKIIDHYDENHRKLSVQKERCNYAYDNYFFLICFSAVIIGISDMPYHVPHTVVHGVLEGFKKYLIQGKKTQLVYDLSKQFIEAPRYLFICKLGNKIISAEQRIKHPILINSYEFLFLTLNVLWMKFLFDLIFSPITKTRHVSCFLNKLPWWIKFSIADHLGEKAKEKISSLYFKKQPNAQ